MAYTRDWDETDPIDHTLNRNWPDEIRDVKEDVADRMTEIIEGFASGETVTLVKKLPFKAQSTPSLIADVLQLYGKAVSGKTELHGLDEDNVEHQYTKDGKLNAAELKGVYPAPASVADLVNLLPLIYPIGTVLTFGVSTNPATLLGFGTWTAIAGKVIVGIDAGQTEFDTLDETGGAKTHTLATSELPSHSHGESIPMRNANGWDGSANFVQASSNSGGSGTYTGSTDSAGSGSAHNNLQPYIVKYVWQRTA